MSGELVFMIVKIQSIFWIFHIMIVLTASRDSWCPIFFLSRLARKLVYAFKIIPFSNFALKSKRQRRFSVWPVDGRFCSPFASTDPSISSSSSALPRTSERMEQGEIRRQISNRGTPAHAEKVFHYFQKGLSRFQSRHTWSLFHFFTILYNFSLFFSAWNYIEIVSETTCLCSCVCPCLNRQARVLLPVFLFWSHSGATEGRWRVF